MSQKRDPATVAKAWDVLGRAAGYGPTGPSSERALDLLWRSAKRRGEEQRKPERWRRGA